MSNYPTNILHKHFFDFLNSVNDCLDFIRISDGDQYENLIKI